jgi:hypothetical protein
MRPPESNKKLLYYPTSPQYIKDEEEMELALQQEYEQGLLPPLRLRGGEGVLLLMVLTDIFEHNPLNPPYLKGD